MLIDILFLIFAGYGFFLGFSKGIIQTVFTILSYLFGIMAAFRFSPAMTDFLEKSFNTDHPLMFIAGFLLTFVLTMVIIRLLAKTLEGVLQTANVNIINQVAGGALLALFMVLAYSIILWFGDRSKILDENAKQESMIYPLLEDLPTQVWEFGRLLQPTFEEFWNYTVDFFEKIEQNVQTEEETKTRFYDIEED